MTDAAWVQGMALLTALGLPGWPTDPKESDMRSAVMREVLDDLCDAEFIHGCRTAAARERFFPGPGVIREYAEAYVSPYPLLGPARSVADREADRAEAIKGIEILRAAVHELDPALARSFVMPPTPKGAEVIATDERLSELRRQAAAITAGDHA
jgi:hypothetical protein